MDANKVNFEAFKTQLANEYTDLFASDPQYIYAKNKFAPEQLALKMTVALESGTGDKEGEGVKRACKHFKIKHTYKAIRAFLNE